MIVWLMIDDSTWLLLTECSSELVVYGGQLLLPLLCIRGSLLDDPAGSLFIAEVAGEVGREHFAALVGRSVHCWDMMEV